jgi:hypothetical protein
MTTDEDFQQEMRDQWRIAAQMHRNIMTSNQNVMDAITALTTALNGLNTTVTTAISDMGTGGDTARAGFVTALTAVATQIGAMQTELTTAIAALTPPPTGTPAP